MYRDDSLPLIDQIGEDDYLRTVVGAHINNGAAFYDAMKHRVLTSTNIERLEEKGVYLPRKASECRGFLKNDYKAPLF